MDFFASVPPGGGRRRSVNFLLFRNTSGRGQHGQHPPTLVSSRRLPGLARPMDGVNLCLTVGDTLYAMDAFPWLSENLSKTNLSKTKLSLVLNN